MIESNTIRIEKDFIGEKEINNDCLFGIHSLRAKENFPYSSLFSQEWYKSLGIVKQACYETYYKFKKAANEKYNGKHKLSFIEDDVIEQLIKAAIEVSEGKHFEHFIVPAIQGGAGTSINLNVNEIIANVALKKMNKSPGDYEFIHPIEHANIYQSTNDVIPTSLKIAIIQLLNELEESINKLRFEIEKIEKNQRNNLRIGYT